MEYTVRPLTVDGCHCADCRAGRHLYELYERGAGYWELAGLSLLTYATAEECKRKHWWGIQFGSGDTWEDGAPIVEPEPPKPAQEQTGNRHCKVEHAGAPEVP